jgi:hypothetical protein
MQGRAVAKLAMKASCRHCLHEPRRRPQSTFIVVRHLHFSGTVGLASAMSFVPISITALCSLAFKRRRCVVVSLRSNFSLDSERAVGNRILAYPRGERRFFRLFAGSGLPRPPDTPSCRLPCPPCGYPAAECGRGEPPPTGVLCGFALASVPAGAMDRHPAGGPIARVTGTHISTPRSSKTWSSAVLTSSSRPASTFQLPFAAPH